MTKSITRKMTISNLEWDMSWWNTKVEIATFETDKIYTGRFLRYIIRKTTLPAVFRVENTV